MTRAVRRTALLVTVLTILVGSWWLFVQRARVGAPAPIASTAPVRGGTLVVSSRSEPDTYNRHARPTAAVDALSLLTQARLVRINGVTGALEPWLAEKWTSSADGLTFTLTLRSGVTFSDGVPFTSADVLFSFQVLYDPAVDSVLASAAMVAGRPLAVAAPDDRTVTVRLPAPFAPGLALLSNIPIFPRHQLQAAFAAHTFRDAWGLKTPPGTMAGLGPFVLTEHVPGQRLTLTRNDHYWRKDEAGRRLPYLDRVVMEVVSTQDAEVLRLEAGTIDAMVQADVRPEDYAALKRLSQQGTITLTDVGIGIDPSALWFNLAPPPARATPGYLQQAAFRQAISSAVDREAIVRSVYLGAGVPVYGPVTPGNRTWYAASTPTFPFDRDRARTLLGTLGLTDRNGDGQLEDASGAPVRFSILTQRGHLRERTATVIQEQLRQVGVAVDVVGLDPPSIFQRWSKGDYDSIYFGFQASSLDPANNLDFWLSAGSNHVWHPNQASPATDWEKAIDELMRRQTAASTLAERQRLFADVQRIFGEELPELYFAAPKIAVALNHRVGGAKPGLLDPKVLWSADTLYVSDGASPQR